MKKKIKHAFAYIILAAWTGFIIYGLASFIWGLWGLAVKPFIEIGTVNLLIILICAIGAWAFIFFMFWAIGKLIDWLLEE
jgi:uncharacterized YccA/Bax inhibitor family protein